MNDSSIPLCLCLDGTLTPVRIADERLLVVAKQAPAALMESVRRLIRGKSTRSRQPATPSPIDVYTMPLRLELIEWLRDQRSHGRRLVLVVDGDTASAEQIAAPLGLFDELAPTDSFTGTPAERKRSALVTRFGDHGFDYIGSNVSDKIVWQASRRAIVVGDASIAKRIGRDTEHVQVFPGAKASLRTWLKAMRLYQWAKNGLVFVPPLLAHVITQPHVLVNATLAFVAFGLCASSVYLVNDLFDLAADRQHPRKRLRPFAAGTLSARSGLGAAALLLSVAAIIAAAVGARFVGVLAGYYVLTWAYSLHLKRVPLLDVMMLAALYTLRIIAGAAATQVPVSFWLLAFSVFMFLSLGFVKRYAELDDARKAGKLIGHARGYGDADLPLIMSLGTAAGYSAIVVMALYINSADSQSLYQHHKPLWLICPLMLFWISRIWIVTTRGAMHDDPVVFALRDRASLLILVALGAIVLLSI
jgi:4-hydroxybenzoate polyprenyltransferase